MTQERKQVAAEKMAASAQEYLTRESHRLGANSARLRGLMEEYKVSNKPLIRAVEKQFRKLWVATLGVAVGHWGRGDVSEAMKTLGYPFRVRHLPVVF